jgi:hypothetical protein
MQYALIFVCNVTMLLKTMLIRSETFENSAFVKNNSFSVDSVEVWGFKKYYDSRTNTSRGVRR